MSPDAAQTAPVPKADPAPVRMSRQAEVAQLTLCNPPVNALTNEVREALEMALKEVLADDTVAGVMIAAEGPHFSAGGDLREIGRPRTPSDVPLARLNTMIEDAAKPVVIAIHANAIGGSVLLALACHGRVGTPEARIALPELTMGLVPGAGGTQRLPRLVGVEHACEIVATARPVEARRAHDLGFFDALAEDARQLPDTARGLVRKLVREGPVPTRARRAEPLGPDRLDRWLATARRTFPGRAAAASAIQLIGDACRTPFDTGAAAEAECYAKLAAGPDFRALRHLFFAERGLPREIDTGGDGPGRIELVPGPRGSGVTEIVCHGAVSAAAQTEARRAVKRDGAMPVLVRGEAVLPLLNAALDLALKEVDRGSDAFVGLGALGWRLGDAGAEAGDATRALSQGLAAALSEAGKTCRRAGTAHSDDVIDVLAVRGCGFPARFGGPMYHARPRD